MSQSPYSSTSGQDVPPKDNTLKIVLIVVGVVVLLAVLACGGIIAAGYFAVQKAAEEFGNIAGGEFADEYLQSPEAQEALGEVVETKMDFGNIADDAEAGLKVQVKGTKGSGTLVLGGNDEGEQTAQLIMDDGRVIDLPMPEYEYDDLDMEDDFDSGDMDLEVELPPTAAELQESVEEN